MKLPKGFFIITILLVIGLGFTFNYLRKKDVVMSSNNEIVRVFYLEGSDENWTINKQFLGTLDNQFYFQGGEMTYNGTGPLEALSYNIEVILENKIKTEDTVVISTTKEESNKLIVLDNGALSINGISGPLEGTVKEVMMKEAIGFDVKVIISYRLENGELVEDTVDLNVYEFNL